MAAIMATADKVFHKMFIACDLKNHEASKIQSFNNSKAYYEAASDADKQLIRSFAQEYSYILQSAITSNEIEQVKYVHETLEVDLTMDNNIALVLAWNIGNIELCQWILNIIDARRVNAFTLVKLIQGSLCECRIEMLDFMFRNLNNELRNVILCSRFDSINKFISRISVNWVIANFPDIKPTYNIQNNSVCNGFVLKSRLEYNDANPLEEVIVNSCPVCILEEGEEKSGYVLHSNHSVCKECYSSLFNAGMFSCPLCREPNVIS